MAVEGRRPIGVNQPPNGGTVYPFVNPSADIARLLGDFYLSYEDDHCGFVLPFRLDWLYGFGDTVVEPREGYPTPVHSHDLRIVDAEGAVVFDSTTATGFRTQAWGSRLLILEWLTADEVCRCTKFTTWSSEEIGAGLERSIDQYLYPEDGELDPRTLNRLPLRVKSIRVGLMKFRGYKVVLESGNNIAVSHVPADDSYREVELETAELLASLGTVKVSGKRISKRVVLQANPGDGMGVWPGCDDTETVITNFGGAVPDASGNVSLDAEGCLRVQRPVALIGDTPRQFQYASDDLEHDAAAAAILLGNGCSGPCCDCNLYVRTYKGLTRQWNLWEGMAHQGEETRDTYAANKARWEAQKSCREGHPLRPLLIPEAGCKLVAGASYCNVSRDCLTNIELRFAFTAPPEAAPISSASDCQVTQVDDEDAALSGTWPVLSTFSPYANPQDSTKGIFRICIPLCNGIVTKLTVTVHYDPPDGVTAPEVEVPEDVMAAWVLAGANLDKPARAIAATTYVPMDNSNPYCARCACPRSEET